MSDLGALGESAIIELLSTACKDDQILKSIGDDCAALRCKEDRLLLWTTDMLIEEVHFLRGHPARKLGQKALNVNLSDIAAMGGKPLACLLSISLPARLEQSWLRSFRDGFLASAAQYSCPLIGGDTCASRGGIGMSITVLGTSNEERTLWRAGAKDGDDIWISGVAGRSALGLKALQAHPKEHRAVRDAVEHHLCPQPRLKLASSLADGFLATCCIDTSDGIAIDLGHICRANNVGAVLELDRLPLAQIPDGLQLSALELALHGGEDYELLFCADKANRQRIEAIGEVSRIGRIDKGVDGILLQSPDGSTAGMLEAGQSGFSHFA